MIDVRPVRKICCGLHKALLTQMEWGSESELHFGLKQQMCVISFRIGHLPSGHSWENEGCGCRDKTLLPVPPLFFNPPWKVSLTGDWKCVTTNQNLTTGFIFHHLWLTRYIPLIKVYKVQELSVCLRGQLDKPARLTLSDICQTQPKYWDGKAVWDQLRLRRNQEADWEVHRLRFQILF